MHKRFIPLALAYVGDEDPIDGRTRLQKMVFVLQQELDDIIELPEEQRYEYFAYDYGPFSKELAEDTDQMIDANLLVEEEVEYDDDGNVKYLYELQSDGRNLIEQELGSETVDRIIKMAAATKQQFNDELSLPEVIDEVYDEYPEYAEESIY